MTKSIAPSSPSSSTASAAISQLVSAKKASLFEQASVLLKPVDRLFSDEWAQRNRVYPPTAPVPGPRNPNLTPYIIPIERALDARRHRRVAAVFGTQMSKTELALDVMGNRLDTAPVPMAYIMPSKKVLDEITEPRIRELLDSKGLKPKAARRQRKSEKRVAGVRVRLITANSASDLSADTLGLIITDEIDKFPVNTKGQGNAVGLADRRGDAYDDFVHFSTSSPTFGPIEVELDEDSGLDFWGMVDQDELRSPIWSMWQTGSRYHWAWPCPHCDEFFIPRFRCVSWEKPKDKDGNELPSNPAMAARTAHMVCPHCGDRIYDADKAAMNARGLYVAPGQRIEKGKVVGDAPDTWTLSYWVSGFCSPFVKWGQRVAEFLEATNARKIDDIQAVVNGFGELFVPGNGDLPEWAELRGLKGAYKDMEVPEFVRLMTLTADVQKNGIYFVIRGWGAGGSSALIHYGYLNGDTSDEGPGSVWDALATVLTDRYDGLPIRLAFIDSGYRPGKKFVVPDHLVYKFCKRFPKLAYPTKGSSSEMRKPISTTKMDVKIDGKTFKRGLDLHRLDTGFFKRWLMMKLSAPLDRDGFWTLNQNVSDDYLKQLVSEVEVVVASGKRKWIQRSKQNHYFDCESMQGAIAMMLNLDKLRDGPRLIPRTHVPASSRRPTPKPDTFDTAPDRAAPETENTVTPRRAKARRSPRESIW